MKTEKNITMKEAKEKTGLSSRQIRYYDQQDLIFPGRSKGNQRLFSDNDIRRLLKIKELLEEGNSIETVKSRLRVPENDTNDQIELNYDNEVDYSDVELDSLFPVSNRSELLKKLSQSNSKGFKEEEE